MAGMHAVAAASRVAYDMHARELEAYCGGQLFQHAAGIVTAPSCDAMSDILMHVEVLQGRPQLVHLQDRGCSFPGLPVCTHILLSVPVMCCHASTAHPLRMHVYPWPDLTRHDGGTTLEQKTAACHVNCSRVYAGHNT